MQYNKEYDLNFIKHHKELPLQDFYTNIFSLGGNIPDLQRMRRSLIEQKFQTKEERAVAYKFMTEEIEEYLKKIRNKNNQQQVQGQLNMLNEMRKKRLEKAKNRGDKGTWKKQRR